MSHDLSFDNFGQKLRACSFEAKPGIKQLLFGVSPIAVYGGKVMVDIAPIKICTVAYQQTERFQ